MPDIYWWPNAYLLPQTREFGARHPPVAIATEPVQYRVCTGRLNEPHKQLLS